MIPVRAHDGLLGWPGIGPTALEDWGAQKFLSKGTFCAPQSGWYFVTGCGGGGGGGTDLSEGGQPGACVIRVPIYLYDGMCLPVTIGPGGANGPDGQYGGDTSLGDWLILKGGPGGSAGAPTPTRGQVEGRFFQYFNLIANTDYVNIAGLASGGTGGDGMDVFSSIYHSYSIATSSASDLCKFGVFIPKDGGASSTAAGYGSGADATKTGAPGFLLIGWIGT